MLRLYLIGTKQNEVNTMSIQPAAKGMRLHIGLYGRRNAGKSSLLNRIAGQDVVIVSHVPGTTADPVDKAMEMPPVGPVLLIDTAGIDDDQEAIGAMRVERTLKTLDRTDLALLVMTEWGQPEEKLSALLKEKKIPFCVVFNKKSDDAELPQNTKDMLAAEKIPCVAVSAKTGWNMTALLEQIIALAPMSDDRMLGGLVPAGSTVLLITPIDQSAPKGRMILPQVQAIRDVLDSDACCVVVKEDAVTRALENLKEPPCLAVTDSQVFGIVSKSVPESLPLTSFSILLARLKGDLATCAAGAEKIASLQDGDKILIAEACTHHAASDDIGRVKIPNWIRKYTGKDVDFQVVSGPDFPDDLATYSLVIHCGACTFNKKAVLSRILRCREAGVPFTNYGIAIAYMNGILRRAIAPFPEMQ